MVNMDTRDQPIHISSLSNELFLHIFESDLTPSAILQCMLCCKRWLSLASSVLYKHIVLRNGHMLSVWAQCPSDTYDFLIETFTLVPIHFLYSRSIPVVRDTRQLRSTLEKLPSRLANMVNLQCLSVYSPSLIPDAFCIPLSLITSIVDHLPQNCVSLEIDVRNMIDDTDPEAHICTSIRRVLPQLRYLRLRFPEVCPEAFGYGFDASQPTIIAAGFKPAEAPRLEQCLITVGYPGPPNIVWPIRLCEHPRVDIVPVLARYLQVFKSPQNAPRLQKLWMIDALPLGDDYNRTSESLVRRDVLADKSQAIPYGNMAERRTDSWFVRLPAEESSHDLVTTLISVKGLVEGPAWVITSNGTRLPAPEAYKKAHLTVSQPVMRNWKEWSIKEKMAPLLWVYEKKSGVKILDVAEGGLTDKCIPTFRIPEGWIIDDDGYLERSE
ncbi:hypothetical protein F4821DRAFT_182399 [Hypoxylon rubiginosum]|uniref:Uncharacterized protein n=1 Tax=Hypoxylon rubiginosum TaxID=110542 RepID=A0ACC0CTN9_9PEZI|nr:hypothetical protein F4821DRAFT_182399 [Hypoxylon rubiginosum]